MASEEMSWPTVELLGSMMALVPVTVTTSFTLPTLRAMLRVVLWSTET